MLLTLLAPQQTGAYTLTAEPGVFVLTGQDATLTYTPVGGFTLAADPGTFTLTGQNANLLYGRFLVAEPATFILTGQDATLRYGRLLQAVPGTFVLSGKDAILTYSGGPPPVTEIAGVGGAQVNQLFIVSGVTELPFAVQRRTS